MNKPTGIVTIGGREYQTVALRVHTFREQRPECSLVTDVLHRDDECVVVRATIADAAGRVLATGHAEEYRADGKINRTSALENAETSAIGRALACLGMGGTEFASADEVARAVSGEKPDYRANPARLMWEKLQPERQDFLRKVAHQVVGCMPDARKALDVLEMADLETEEKGGLWYLLDSSTRSGLKKAAELKEAA